MKFLCLDCDQPMKLHSTESPDEGSLSVTFRCPECGFRVAMLTNPFETQMVRSLGVKVGGRIVPAEPFENLRATMAGGRPDAFEGTGEAGGSCPVDRESTRLDSSHLVISYAVFCFEKKKKNDDVFTYLS